MGKVQSQTKPVAVLISDIHFSLGTLKAAGQSLMMAAIKAVSLKVPLILCGDTLNDKATMRAECVNDLIDIFKYITTTKVYVLVGNHDLINEKGREHTLNFLRPYCTVVSRPYNLEKVGVLLPYYSDAEELKAVLSKLPLGSRIIMHQGVQSAYMGEYAQDKTSLPAEFFSDFRVISGHYHRAQDIKCGRPRKGAVGLFSYVGNPYTLSFGEANDGPKGFQVLHSDGLMTQFVPKNIRKHVIVERDVSDLDRAEDDIKEGDLVWLKVRGSELELSKIKKQAIADKLFQGNSFKMDKIVIKNEAVELKSDKMTEPEIMDSVIDATAESDGNKDSLKRLWREVYEVQDV